MEKWGNFFFSLSSICSFSIHLNDLISNYFIEFRITFSYLLFGTSINFATTSSSDDDESISIDLNKNKIINKQK